VHISSSSVKIRLYIENQLPRLSGNGLKVCRFFLWHPNFVLHISFSWVKIRLYTENQCPRLSGSGIKVCCDEVVVVGYTPITLSHQLRVELRKVGLELGCDKNKMCFQDCPLTSFVLQETIKRIYNY
jgi:hypothetical protein